MATAWSVSFADPSFITAGMQRAKKSSFVSPSLGFTNSTFFLAENPYSFSSVAASTGLPDKSVNSNGCNVLKYNSNDTLFAFNTLETPSMITRWNGRITMLSINMDAVLISSALLPNPVESLMPNNIGETTRCAIITFWMHSDDKN